MVSCLSLAKDQCVVSNTFRAVVKLWSGKVRAHNEKLSLFFVDTDFIPLLVQENYLASYTSLDSMSRAADSLAFSDTLQTSIRSQSDWSLLPLYAQASTLEPVAHSQVPLDNIQFPELLAKMSVQRKNTRLRSELKDCFAPVSHISAEESVSEYAYLLTLLCVTTLIEKGKSGVSEVKEVMDEYRLSLDMLRKNCLEISPAQLNSTYKLIEKGVKTALTKAFGGAKPGQKVLEKPESASDSDFGGFYEET